MSCNGCRVLRKGCSDNCMLRQSIRWIDNPQAQANATVYVAKFFGRAGLMSFISSVPESQRPALFQSLLFEAVGRTVNPVSGAVGLLRTGNWHVCQSAVHAVLRRGVLSAIPAFLGGVGVPPPVVSDDTSESGVDCFTPREKDMGWKPIKRKADGEEEKRFPQSDNLDLCLMSTVEGWNQGSEDRRARTPSDESETTTSRSSLEDCGSGERERKPLKLFF